MQPAQAVINENKVIPLEPVEKSGSLQGRNVNHQGSKSFESLALTACKFAIGSIFVGAIMWAVNRNPTTQVGTDIKIVGEVLTIAGLGVIGCAIAATFYVCVYILKPYINSR